MSLDLLTRLAWALGISLVGIGIYTGINRWLLARVNSSLHGLGSRERPAILYFTSPDCAPCKTVQWPAIELLKAQLGEVFDVVEIDASRHPELASRWGVLSVPTTFILDQKGSPRFVNHGAAPARKLQSQIRGLI